jgi:hypothetical protein
VAGAEICRLLRQPASTDGEIFQLYLDQIRAGRAGGRSHRRIYGLGKPEEVQINQSRTQRVIMVAANFRKEVTNTALWLMQFGIRVQCFKVKPYKFNEDVFVDIRQVIPTPEAESFMIGMAQKEAEEQSTSGGVKAS